MSGPTFVIEAIALGQKVTNTVDKYLGGDKIIEEPLVDTEKVIVFGLRKEILRRSQRVDTSLVHAKQLKLGGA